MKNIKLLLLLSLLALVPVVLVGCGASETQYKVPNAYLTIDINPSVEIITDEEGLITVVTPLNEDAELLLIDVDFTGMAIDEATEKIVEMAIEMGYIGFTSDNAIIITAEAGEATENLTKTLAEKVEAFVSKRKMNIEVLKSNFEATPEIKELANELGISIGKLKLITVAMANNPELTVEAGADMSVRDINRIIIDARKEIRDFYKVEFHDQFQQLKTQLRINYQKDKTTLLNDIIQIADINAFTDFDLTAEQITEIKTLYQAYLDELFAIDLNVDNDEDNSDENTEDLIAELNNQRNTIREQIKNELRNMMKNRQNSKEDKDMIQSRIKGFRDELAGLDEEITDALEEYRNINGNLKYHWIFRNHNRVNKPINPVKQLHQKYQELLDEYEIDIDDLEEKFIEQISEQLDTLHQEYQQILDNYKEELKVQAEIIKQQLIDEKLALKKIWRNNK